MEQRKDYIESQIEMLSRALRKLFEKMLNLNPFDNVEEVEKELQLELLVDTFSLHDLLMLDNNKLVETLTVKHKCTTTHVKIIGDILFEYAKRVHNNMDVYYKAKILYQFCQANEKSTIDFAILSKLAELDLKIKAYIN